MSFVIFVAPRFSENASAMIAAIAGVPDVQLGVIAEEPIERAPASVRDVIAAHWRVDSVVDAGQILGAVRELMRRHGAPARVFGAYEQLQVPVAEVREQLGIEGMSAQIARNFRDKDRMKDVLRDAGIPVARHRLATSAAAVWDAVREIGLPLVLKPPAGAGAQATYRVASADDVHAALARNEPTPERPVLVEEFLHGQEHSLETISVGGRAVWHSLTRYYPTPLQVLEQPWIQWCVVLPRETGSPEYADIRDVGARALAALGMQTGLTHMEWFRRPDGSVAISEVAARPPGAQITTLVSRANDVDFLGVWARLMVTGEFTPPRQRYAVGAAYLRGQGNGPDGRDGRVVAVHGLDRIEQELGPLIVDYRLPVLGQTPTGSYEGEGYIIVRHPETEVVEQAVLRIVSLARVQLG